MALPTADATTTVHAGAVIDAFDLGLTVTTEYGADTAPSACGSSDGCGSTCASACASAR